MNEVLRVRLVADDPIRHRGLTAMLENAGFVLVADAPDVVLADLGDREAPWVEAEAPVVVLSDGVAPADVGGVLPRSPPPCQLDAALRAVAAGLLVRLPGALPAAILPAPGFASADDAPSLTTREAEILALVGQGSSNKTIARRLGISVHTVKFHLEALFQKIGATCRAEAVAKGLRHGVIEL